MPDTFRAATWNLLYTTPPRELRPILQDLLEERRVGLFLLQEVTRPDVADMFRGAGLRLHHTGPRYAVAWDPEEWRGHGRDARLARSTYRRRGGQEVVTRAAVARLTDREGRTLTAMSYQLPSAVQRARPLPGRLTVLRESMATMRALPREYDTDAYLLGGDDNVDERLAHGPWGFMLRRSTGLRLVQAPDPTHAGGRHLDDFRVHGLEVRHGWTQRGGGDHRVHGRVFAWK